MTMKWPAARLDAKTLVAFAYFFIIVTAYYLIKTVRASLVISHLGSAQLPYLYIISAVVLGGLVAWYARVSRGVAPQRLMQGILVALIAQLVAFRWALELPYAWISGLFYLWVSMFSVITVTQFWMVANDLFSPDKAKEAFTFIGTGGIAGGMAGGAVASLLVGWMATEDLLFVAAGLLGLCAVLLRMLWRFQPTTPLNAAHVHERQESVDQPRSLLSYLKEFHYLRHLLVLVVVAKVISTIVDYQFNGMAELFVSGTEARTALFGMFYTGIGLASLATQLVLTSQLFKRFGVHRSLAVLPVGLAAGLLVLWVVPGLAVAALLALYDRSLSYSLGQTGREVLYVPVPSAVRYQVKPLIDAAAFRLAQGMAGVVLLIAQQISQLPIQAYSFLALPLIGIWLLALHRLRTVEPSWARGDRSQPAEPLPSG